MSGMSRNYIDDVIVFSEDWCGHLRDVKSVIECLGKAGLRIKRRKCEFGRRYLE